jgi:ABC-type microcin C transport system permease subunit YejB
MRFDFGESYFRDIGHRPDHREAAGFDLARAVDDADFLRHLDSAGHRKAVKDGSRFDIWTSAVIIVGLRDPRLPVRDPADRPVRRRIVLGPLPAARADLGQLGSS